MHICVVCISINIYLVQGKFAYACTLSIITNSSKCSKYKYTMDQFTILCYNQTQYWATLIVINTKPSKWSCPNNNHYLPFLGEYQIYASKAIIIAREWIHSTQFIDRIKKMTSYTTQSTSELFCQMEVNYWMMDVLTSKDTKKLWKNLFLEKLQNSLQNGELNWCLFTFVLLLMMWKKIQLIIKQHGWNWK